MRPGVSNPMAHDRGKNCVASSLKAFGERADVEDLVSVDARWDSA